MVDKPLPIIWDKEAISYLKAAIKFIHKDSPQNALLVKEKVLSAVSQIPENPVRYPADKYRVDNDGNYRAFEIYRFRIAYFIEIDRIRIIRVRHTSQEPLDY